MDHYMIRKIAADCYWLCIPPPSEADSISIYVHVLYKKADGQHGYATFPRAGRQDIWVP